MSVIQYCSFGQKREENAEKQMRHYINDFVYIVALLAI